MSEITVVSSARRLAELAAERFVTLASTAIAERGRFVVALAGGSTPQPMYRLLADVASLTFFKAEAPRSLAVDWSRVELFWGDERCVPPDHPDSNYRMARQALLPPLVPPSGGEILVHRILGELPPAEAAAAYRVELEAVLGDKGRFDLILLGLGSDGHTASLFPETTALEERRYDAVAVYVEKLDAWRVTLTLPVINNARHVIFLVSGERKADALARVHADQGTTSIPRLPAELIQPTDGTLTWLVDRDAAAKLEG